MLVSPKESILDPQGSAGQGSLEHLGFSVSDARVGRIVDLDIDAGSEEEAKPRVVVHSGLPSSAPSK